MISRSDMSRERDAMQPHCGEREVCWAQPVARQIGSPSSKAVNESTKLTPDRSLSTNGGAKKLVTTNGEAPWASDSVGIVPTVFRFELTFKFNMSAKRMPISVIVGNMSGGAYIKGLDVDQQVLSTASQFALESGAKHLHHRRVASVPSSPEWIKNIKHTHKPLAR